MYEASHVILPIEKDDLNNDKGDVIVDGQEIIMEHHQR